MEYLKEMEQMLQQIPSEQAEEAMCKAIEILARKRPQKSEAPHKVEKPKGDMIFISDKRTIELGEGFSYMLSLEELLDLIDFHFSHGVRFAKEGEGEQLSWPNFIREQLEYAKKKASESAATLAEA